MLPRLLRQPPGASGIWNTAKREDAVVTKHLTRALDPSVLVMPGEGAKVPWTDRGAHSCIWRDDNLSRNGLLDLWRSERSEENLPQNLSSTSEDEPSGTGMVEAQTVIDIRQIEGRFNQTLGADEQQPVANVILTPGLSGDQPLPERLPPGMQRLEQVRQKVLQSTRAYLEADSRLCVNAQDPRGDVNETEM
ncbi:hypothetical protein AYL99_05870 [Fonsecaea erecta]|uniref:Uncharacterized protein n=1 Tax=Fonsecaea erecta TaxID=1367422 RepID=A0A178ZM32_9EURO|nr:hypothetical protein AYL99_05870 [Fonsecaea erecta]OAP60868.1 hypothetical protein AYL99_05870 [Fonsecaea erecta]